VGSHVRLFIIFWIFEALNPEHDRYATLLEVAGFSTWKRETELDQELHKEKDLARSQAFKVFHSVVLNVKSPIEEDKHSHYERHELNDTLNQARVDYEEEQGCVKHYPEGASEHFTQQEFIDTTKI
jgi:hypothetical protein